MSSESSETKIKILSAALKLLVASNGKDVRMSDIAKAAGVSRQAVYLNFESRTDLMVATIQYGDQINDAATQVQPWRDAEGVEKLDVWIEFRGNCLPQIFGVAKSLMVARETDEAAAAAWLDRMADFRRSCHKTVCSLDQTGVMRCRYASSSIDFLIPSIQPQQSTSMTISPQVTLLFPVFFLNTLTHSSLSDA